MGSIAEGYIAKECLTFCSRYLHGIETKFNRMARYNVESTNQHRGGLSLFSLSGSAAGKPLTRYLNPHEWA